MANDGQIIDLQFVNIDLNFADSLSRIGMHVQRTTSVEIAKVTVDAHFFNTLRQFLNGLCKIITTLNYMLNHIIFMADFFFFLILE